MIRLIEKVNIKHYILFIFILFFSSNINAQLTTSDSETVDKLLSIAKHFEGNNNLSEASKFNDKAAFLLWRKNMKTEAEELYLKTLAYYQSAGNNKKIASTSSNLAVIYVNEKKYEKAISYFSDAIKANKGNSKELISDYKDISAVFLKKGAYSESISYTEKALAEAEKVNDNKNKLECYINLSEAHKKNGNDERFLYYYNLFLGNQGKGSNEVVVDNHNSNTEIEEDVSNNSNNNSSNNNATDTDADSNNYVTDNKNASNTSNANSEAIVDSTDKTHNIVENDTINHKDEVSDTNVEDTEVDNYEVAPINKNKNKDNAGVIVMAILAVLVLMAVILVLLSKKRTVRKSGYEVISHISVTSPEVLKKKKLRKSKKSAALKK